jgi:hypothetical protein
MSSGPRPGRRWHSHDVLHYNPEQLNRLFRFLYAHDADYHHIKLLQRDMPDVTDDHILAYMILRRMEMMEYALNEIARAFPIRIRVPVDRTDDREHLNMVLSDEDFPEHLRACMEAVEVKPEDNEP